MKKISILALFIAILCILPARIYAVSYTTAGGIDVENDKAKYFTEYSLSSTEFVYNEAGGTSSTAGWVPMRSAKTRTLHYLIEDVTGTATLTFKGTIMGTDNESSIINDIEVGTTTSGFIPIVEDLDEIRVGGKMESGSAKITIWGKFPGI